MRVLLDTHALLWFRLGSPELSMRAKEVIESPANELLLSVASLWEMSIKVNLGKLDLGKPYEAFIRQLMVESEISILHAALEHFDILSSMPLHHRDPFDRLLVAQCLADDLPIASADSALDDYGVTRIW